MRLAALAAAAALAIGFLLYSPALHAPYFFDDLTLNIRLGERDEPIRSALLSRRPVLSTSYWLDYQWTGDDPAGYRYVNVAIHAVNVGLVFLVLFRLLELAGWEAAKRRTAALLGAAIFLIHPLQTESVAYIAGRSESLCTLFMLASYALFLYRPKGPISWGRAAAVLLAAGVAATTKENGVAIGGVLLLTDYFWGPARMESVADQLAVVRTGGGGGGRRAGDGGAHPGAVAIGGDRRDRCALVSVWAH